MKHGDPSPSTYPGSNKKTYCATEGNWAWTIFPSSEHQYIILCPSLFDKSVPDTIDTSAAEEGLVLDKREAKSITWLHEIFHLEFAPVDTVDQSPDAKRKSPKWKKDKTEYAKFATSVQTLLQRPRADTSQLACEEGRI